MVLRGPEGSCPGGSWRVLAGPEEVSNIKSYEFLNKLYFFLDNQTNQGLFVINFFAAAGSQHFKVPIADRKKKSKRLEGQRHYAKDRPLSPKIKESFPKPFRIDSLAAFISENLNDRKLSACMIKFGIPSEAEQDKEKFAYALAKQFSLFVESTDDEVNDAIWDIYKALLAENSISKNVISGPRYPGDDVYVENGDRRYEADCYEVVHHKWRLQNRGTQEWHKRTMVLVNGDEINPKPFKTSIPVPDTLPSGFTIITTDINAGSAEGAFECKWEMRDADGFNCFPNKRWAFNIRIKVSFQPIVGGNRRG